MIRDIINQLPNKTKYIGKYAVYDVGHGKKDGSYPMIGILDPLDLHSGIDLDKELVERFPNYEITSTGTDMIYHDDIGVIFAIERDDDAITKMIPLVNIVQIKGDTLPNGNVLYKGFTIIRSGKPGTNDKFEYEIAFISNLTTNSIEKLPRAPKFKSAEDAIKYIDSEGLRVSVLYE